MIRCTDTKQHAAEIIRLSLATWPIALTPTRPYTWRPHADDTYTYTAARTSARAAWRFVCCVAIRWASKHLVAWPRSHLSLLLYPAVYVLLPTSLHIKIAIASLNVADVVAVPYFERPAGPTWRCHIPAGHPAIDSWLRNYMHQLHPVMRMAFRDESRLMSEKMRHLFLYEVLVRVAGGLLFELLGQSVGDRERDEDDIPIVVRSYQGQKFLITALHVKGPRTNSGVLGITEVRYSSKNIQIFNTAFAVDRILIYPS